MRGLCRRKERLVVISLARSAILLPLLWCLCLQSLAHKMKRGDWKRWSLAAPPYGLATEDEMRNAGVCFLVTCHAASATCVHWPRAPYQFPSLVLYLSWWLNMPILRPGSLLLWGVPCPCDAGYPVMCKVKTNKKDGRLKLLLYILSVSQTSCWVRRWILFSRREEFRIFCRSFDWPIEILTTCPIEDNNISYSNHALPSKLVLFFVLFLSRDIDICMVNGNRNSLSFSQDWHLLVVFASFEELEHSGVFHSSQHFFFLHSEVWAVTLTYEIFLQRKKSRFQKKRKKKVKTFTCVMSCWYT